MAEIERVALTRRPSSLLAEGLVTHIQRQPVDVELAYRQHDGYVKALRDNGWHLRAVTPIEECPDSAFIEDAVIVCGGLAVLTRPAAPSRLPEISGAETAVLEVGLEVARLTAPATLDGGDVLQVGADVYVGRGGRTNAEGIRQLREILTARGRRVIAVPLGAVLHLKSAVTALPDGTFLMWPGLVDAGLFGAVRMVAEEPGAHVVPLGGDRVLIAASAPRTTDAIADLGFQPVVVDISEYEKLEGCVTCLSVLIGGDCP